MSISGKNTPHACLIAGHFTNPKHMLDPLNRIWRDIGFTKSTKAFLRDLLDLFCRTTARQSNVGFLDNEMPVWGFSNAFLEREFDTSKRQIQRYISRLEALGVIERSIDNGNRRIIDFTPLPALAVQWKQRLDEEIERQTNAKELLNQYRKHRHRASVILQNTIPSENNSNALNRLRSLLAGSADSDEGRRHLIDEFREVFAEVHSAVQIDLDEQSAVEKNFDSMAEMTPPHDENTDPYRTTTPDPKGSVVESNIKGVAALIGASRRAATDQRKPNKKEGMLYSNMPVEPSVAWGLILQLAPAFAPAQRVSRDPAEQAHEIARRFIPVREDVLDAAISEHGAINVIAALALAFSQEKFYKDFGGNRLKAKAAYATGILSKFRAGSGVPTDQIFNPWPSMFARLKAPGFIKKSNHSSDSTSSLHV